MTALRCRVARHRMPATVERGEPSGHIATCLRCQAEESRYRLLLRELRDLRRDEANAPPHLATAVMDEIDAPAIQLARTPSRSNAVVAIAGGTAVAIAAAAAIAGLRHRRAA